MKLLVAATSLLLATAAHADPAIDATINGFIDAFNKGDAVAAGATHEASPVIIDEVPPYMWTGQKAFATWLADLVANDKAVGISGEKVTIKAPTRTLITGSKAYVVVPATYNFTQKGVAMREPAQFTFAMAKGKTGWKIAGWTWTGPDPKPVK